MALPSLSCIKYNRPYLKHETKRNSNVRSKRLMKAAGVKSQRVGERASIEEQLSHAAETYKADVEERAFLAAAELRALIGEDCQVYGWLCVLDIEPGFDDSWDEL